jgi:hypothetical protein
MQLRRTGIIAALYNKETSAFDFKDFEVLSEANFIVRDQKVVGLSADLHSVILESYNQRHVALFNLHRLNQLDIIGQVLYKRIFYHLSNIVSEKDLSHFKRTGTWPSTLRIRKDYEAICHEWLGGLKPRRHKSDIVRETKPGKEPLKRKDQLGPHFEQLNATTVTSRCLVEKNAKRTGFNVFFYPGPGFFEDYCAYYLNQSKPTRTAQAADLREVKSLELVAEFHRQLGHSHNRFPEHEKAFSDELLQTYSEDDIRDLIAYSLAEAKKTGCEVLYFGWLKQFVAPWSANRHRRRKRARQVELAKECPFCRGAGMLELKEEGTSRYVAHPCPHQLEQVVHIERQLNAHRV